METKDLRYLLRFFPRLSDLSPWLLDDAECCDLDKCHRPDCDLNHVQQAWDDLESIHCVLSNLLKHRPLPF